MAIFTGFDLTIESALAIRGATVATEPAAAPDLRVTRLPPAPERAADEPLYRLEGDTLVFAVAEAVYRCRADEIALALRPNADLDSVASLLIATALPAALWLRGEFVLHAAAVVPPDGRGAVAILGASGAGKSTVAAQLFEAGANLLADDTLRLSRAGDTLIGSGLAGGYHLAAAPGAAREFHILPPERTVRRAPLIAAFVLSRTDGAPRIRRLAPPAAIRHWLMGQHRPRIPALLGQRANALDVCALLAQRTPLYSWARGEARLTSEEWSALWWALE